MPKTEIAPGGMGQPISRRTTAGWEVIIRFRYLNGTRAQVKRRRRLKAEAIEAAQAEARRLIEAGRGYADDHLTRRTPVPQAVEMYLDSEISNENTKSVYKRHLRKHIEPEMKSLCVGEVTTPMVERFLTSRSQGIHRSCRAILSGCWRWLTRRGVVPYNVVAATSPAPTERILEYRSSTAEEIVALLTAAHAYNLPWIAPALLAYAGTGLRRGEIVNLRWDDLEERDGLIYLNVARLKKRDERNSRGLVALPDLLVAELLEWKKKNGTEFIFPGHPPTRPMRGESVKTGFARFLKWARDPDVSGDAISPEVRSALPQRIAARDFRHAVATAITDTQSLYDASLQLGHSRSSTTERYYVHRPRSVDHRAAIETLLGKSTNKVPSDEKTR
ncbi:hypothetical protein HMPREF2651_10315 [Corynebacterium sp. HMSC063A05]|uniref:site-specific integrase n=1 Tax=Corynebacterium TaxID=1716 RepID=UPI0008A4182F|nr:MULTISPECIES: tyrosine-type recombinase/integrase [Corynebacterium]MBC6807573.1 hypothetical protein [Corynebacterium sp. LK30]OFM83389.1 hypothetical protein HMPREF2651_10315 [Corynebacterium sp. HMSC063A05]QQU96969.1 tyrosine-type recombinase/integrase [Corynebacterium amycolatum]